MMKKKPTKARSRDLRTRRYAALPGLSQSRGNCLEWPASGHLKVECISWDPELGRSEFQSNSLKLTKRLTGTLSSTSTLAPTGLTGLAGGTIVVQCDLPLGERIDCSLSKQTQRIWHRPCYFVTDFVGTLRCWVPTQGVYHIRHAEGHDSKTPVRLMRPLSRSLHYPGYTD